MTTNARVSAAIDAYLKNTGHLTSPEVTMPVPEENCTWPVLNRRTGKLRPCSRRRGTGNYCWQHNRIAHATRARMCFGTEAAGAR